MLSYIRQVAICESIREPIKQALVQSSEVSVRQKANDIPTKESILRAASLRPNLDTEEKLRDFLMGHILDSLRLTADQREHLGLNG
jgi:hypothetical protein